ncbi:band 4.1-like protein 3a isoform X11 [Erpetoichthys calabaricus]|uniref:band 4.1-like protein 3a isoform X11 n=1 Tax=Erpetoichthys calabaricus TaxID=27687 RepID=UPI002234D36D|nr:band 4.1-like protein 3a isoform X11 [Erpetoichthys calabaricus]
MTTDSGSDSESKQDKEQEEQKGSSQQQTTPQQQAPAEEVQQFDAEQFPAAAAHSTPARKEQNGDRDGEALPVSKPEYQQFEDDKASQKSSSSKLSKSPLKSVKRPKNMQCKVTLLDGADYTCVVEKRAKGQALFDKVCDHLNLLEKDYFGITFRDTENQKNWLDPAKEIKKQIRSGAWQFAFNVKFYPPDPSQLIEDITRYYLCLQLRDDVVSGRLPCSFATHALLGSYTVQSELGDYDTEEYGTDYVSEFRFAPNPTKELEEKVMELHKNYKGMTPAEAEMLFLENAKKLSMYGVDLHHARDSEGVEIMLGVCASGLLIYRDRLRINRFAWPKVLKISYKRNNFYIKIRPGEFEQFESTIGFKLPNHRAAKRLWKVCVEHHTFFRLVSPEAPPKKFLTLGSKFRYSGRTQAQTRRASSQIVRPAPYFERSSSKRYTMSRSLDGASVSENHEIFMKDSMSASEMGTAQYGTMKGITSGDLITTVTPEKKAEEEKAEEEEVKIKEEDIPEPAPVSPVRNEAKSDQEEESEIKQQATDDAQEELIKHQTNISELKRTFLETTMEASGPTEWEKRLSTSPIRTIPRLEDAPMIEPLVPEDTKETTEKGEPGVTEVKYKSIDIKSEDSDGWVIIDKMPAKVTAGEVKDVATYKVVAVTDTVYGNAQSRSSELKTLEDFRNEMKLREEEFKSKSYTLGKSYDTMSGKVVTMTTRTRDGDKSVTYTTQDLQRKMHPPSASIKVIPVSTEYEILEPEAEKKEEKSISLTFKKTESPFTSTIIQKKIEVTDFPSEHRETDRYAFIKDTGHLKEKPMKTDDVMHSDKALTELQFSQDPTFTIATAHFVAESSPTSRVAIKQSSGKSDGKVFTLVDSSSGQIGKMEWSSSALHSLAQTSEVKMDSVFQTLKEEVHQEEHTVIKPPVVKTETVSFSSAAQMEREEISTKEVPVIHTETKTITYESSQGDDASTDPGILMSAQTITSETTSTTTTTHITKTVKGGISETRIEKRIVITGDADIDHDQALAQAIKEAKEQHPDMSVTKVVVHKETEITPEDGEE